MNRVRAGYCDVPKPFNPKQVSRVSLNAQDVSAIVFWTRDPKPLMKFLPELDRLGYKYYFQYTVLGYPAAIDPNSPPVKSAIRTFRELSSAVGKNRVIWRYDPILFSGITPEDWHVRQLSMLIDELKGYTERLIISFIDPYRKTKIRMSKEAGDDLHLAVDVFEARTYYGLSGWLAGKALSAGLEVFSCAEEADLAEFGIKHGKCIDADIIAGIAGDLPAAGKDPSQRKLCGCISSKDIGVNNTCMFGCRYCYATSNMKTSEANFKSHIKTSSSLAGRNE